jgi:hypothetical protein
MRVRQRCNICERWFPLTAAHWHRDPSRKCGLCGACKACAIERGKIWYEQIRVTET